AAMRCAAPGVAPAIATSSRKSDCHRAKLSLAKTTGQPRRWKRSRSPAIARAARTADGAMRSAPGKSNRPIMSTTSSTGTPAADTSVADLGGHEGGGRITRGEGFLEGLVLV